MAETQSIQITGQDIESVATKLEAFGRDLPPNERVVIDWLLQRAAEAPPDDQGATEVEGYLFSTAGTFTTPQAFTQGAAFSQRFGRAVGYGGNASAVTVNVGVGVRGGFAGLGS